MEQIPNKANQPFGFTKIINLIMDGSEDGVARGHIDVIADLMNPHGVVHGGVQYAMADTLMGSALYTKLAQGETCATIELKINYFRPVTSGRIDCETVVVHKGRSTAVMESTLTNGGKVVAKAMGTFAIILL